MKPIRPFFLSPLLCAISCLISCGPSGDCPDEEPSKHTEYRISNDSKSKIPYTGKDTLVFISDVRDTAVLYGQGKHQYMNETAKNRNIDPGCPFYDYADYEYIDFSFTGKNAELNNLYCSYYIKGSSEYTIINNNGNNLGLSGLFYANNEPIYDEVISIKGNNYKAIGLSPGVNDTTKVVFYNYHLGILKIKLKTGREWIRNF